LDTTWGGWRVSATSPGRTAGCLSSRKRLQPIEVCVEVAAFAVEVCALCDQPGLGFHPKLGYLREEIVCVLPTLCCSVEVAEFAEAVACCMNVARRLRW
jgi:hypothetical protein